MSLRSTGPHKRSLPLICRKWSSSSRGARAVSSILSYDTSAMVLGIGGKPRPRAEAEERHPNPEAEVSRGVRAVTTPAHVASSGRTSCSDLAGLLGCCSKLGSDPELSRFANSSTEAALPLKASQSRHTTSRACLQHGTQPVANK